MTKEERVTEFEASLKEWLYIDYLQKQLSCEQYTLLESKTHELSEALVSWFIEQEDAGIEIDLSSELDKYCSLRDDLCAEHGVKPVPYLNMEGD